MGNSFLFPVSVGLYIAWFMGWFIGTKLSSEHPEYIFYLGSLFFIAGCIEAWIRHRHKPNPLKTYIVFLDFMEKEAKNFQESLIPPQNLTGEFLAQKSISWEVMNRTKLDYIDWRLSFFRGTFFALKIPEHKHEGFHAPTSFLGNGYLQDQNQWMAQLKQDLEFFQVFRKYKEDVFSDRFLERPQILNRFKDYITWRK